MRTAREGPGRISIARRWVFLHGSRPAIREPPERTQTRSPTRGASLSITSIFGGKRPDITPAQIAGLLVAGVPAIATLLRVFGVYDLSPDQQKALEDMLTWGGVIAGVLFASDAGLRAARNHADARTAQAAAATVAVTPGGNGLSPTPTPGAIQPSPPVTPTTP